MPNKEQEDPANLLKLIDSNGCKLPCKPIILELWMRLRDIESSTIAIEEHIKDNHAYVQEIGKIINAKILEIEKYKAQLKVWLIIASAILSVGWSLLLPLFKQLIPKI